jgi:hypothetical protein
VTRAFAAGAVAVAVGDSWLLANCWRTRTVLGGILAAGGIALVGLAVASRLRGGAGGAALLIAGALSVVGCVLYGLGQAFERLLHDKPEDEA